MWRSFILVAAALAGCVAQAPTAENFHNVDHQFIMSSAGHWKALASLAAAELKDGKIDLADPKPDPSSSDVVTNAIFPNNDYSHKKPNDSRCMIPMTSLGGALVAFAADDSPSDFSTSFRDLLTSELTASQINVVDGPVDPILANAVYTLNVKTHVDKHTVYPRTPLSFFGLGTLLGAAGLIAQEPPTINPVQSLIVGASGGYAIDLARQYFPHPTDAEVVVSVSVVGSNKVVECAVSYVLYVPSRETDKYVGTPTPTPEAKVAQCGKDACETKTYAFQDPPKDSTLTLTLNAVAPSPYALKSAPSTVTMTAEGTGASAEAAIQSLIAKQAANPQFQTNYVDVYTGEKGSDLVVRAPKAPAITVTVTQKVVPNEPPPWNIVFDSGLPDPSDSTGREILRIAVRLKQDGTKEISIAGTSAQHGTVNAGDEATSKKLCQGRVQSVRDALLSAFNALNADFTPSMTLACSPTGEHDFVTVMKKPAPDVTARK